MQEEVAQARHARAELAKLQALRKQARPGPCTSSAGRSGSGRRPKLVSGTACALLHLATCLAKCCLLCSAVRSCWQSLHDHLLSALYLHSLHAYMALERAHSPQSAATRLEAPARWRQPDTSVPVPACRPAPSGAPFAWQEAAALREAQASNQALRMQLVEATSAFHHALSIAQTLLDEGAARTHCVQGLVCFCQHCSLRTCFGMSYAVLTNSSMLPNGMWHAAAISAGAGGCDAPGAGRAAEELTCLAEEAEDGGAGAAEEHGDAAEQGAAAAALHASAGAAKGPEEAVPAAVPSQSPAG